jgi:hypothetical protein
VYAAPVDNEVALHNRIVDACQIIRNYHGIFEQMRQSIVRGVEVYIESHGGYFEYIWDIFLLLVCGSRAQICPYSSVTPVYLRTYKVKLSLRFIN